jgi:nitrate/TMAO reductase-like tetraheme cytochrome c subunit
MQRLQPLKTNNARNRKKHMKRLQIILGGLALGAAMTLMPLSSTATIIGSPHDFSPTGTSGYSQLGIATYGHGSAYNNACQVCHIPHGAAANSAANAPLWNHAVATNATSEYVTYDQAGSATFNALGLNVMLGSSVACLSCHDGSIAVNQSYGSTTFSGNGGVATNVPSWAVVTYDDATGKFDYKGGTDLTHMHPIGVSYPAAVTAANIGGNVQLNPATAGSLLSAQLKGVNQSVECATCHDIHQTLGASATAPDSLIVTINGSALCLECHNK